MTNTATLAELAEALGVSKQAVSQRASREGWQFEEESVRGGQRRVYPLATLPAPIRTAVIAKRTTEIIVSSSAALHEAAAFPVESSNRSASTGLSIPCTDLTDKQRQERDARNGVLAAIRRLRDAGISQEAAITTLLTTARVGGLAPALDAMLRLARDARGRAGDGYPSPRTLKRWLSAPDLAPKVVQRDMSIPDWAKAFLGHYRTPQKPSVKAAYREYLKECQPGQIVPSLHQVRRFLGKLGTVTRESGRMGPRELKNIQPFVRRSFDHLEPNDIWTADGHCFDAEVQHPLHGRPFRPEITAIVDIATRRCVGWSIDLAESGTAVADALRYAVERNGIPAIFYVDNGSGYKNAMMNDAVTGLMGRLGTDIRHSIAYNSQARGVIERFHQFPIQLAKQLPSYIGAAMDREARLAQFKVTRKALKSGGTLPLIPFDIFIQFFEAGIAEYNARPHRTLKGTSPDLALSAFSARGWVALGLNPGETETLFRPRVTRTIQRAEIALFTNIYFARELAEFHGLEAQIAYDIHDPSRIWVYTSEGRFICEAQANGNRRHYMPVPVVQQARERRAKGRLARVDAKRDEILEELHGAPAIAAPSSRQIVIAGRVIDTEALAVAIEHPTEAPRDEQDAPEHAASDTSVRSGMASVVVSRSERTAAENYADWLAIDARIASGEELAAADARWHRMYPASAQYRAEAAKRKAAA